MLSDFLMKKTNQIKKIKQYYFNLNKNLNTEINKSFNYRYNRSNILINNKNI